MYLTDRRENTLQDVITKLEPDLFRTVTGLSVKDFHTARGEPRKWTGHAELSKGGDLDIQPGDMVLIDWDLTGTADHIVLASSYDSVTGYLVTIGGNDSGFVVAAPGKHKEATEGSKRDIAEEATGLELTEGGGGKVAVGANDVVDRKSVV